MEETNLSRKPFYESGIVQFSPIVDRRSKPNPFFGEEEDLTPLSYWSIVVWVFFWFHKIWLRIKQLSIEIFPLKKWKCPSVCHWGTCVSIVKIFPIKIYRKKTKQRKHWKQTKRKEKVLKEKLARKKNLRLVCLLVESDYLKL